MRSKLHLTLLLRHSFSLLLVLAMTLGMVSANAAQTRTVTDLAGRTVAIPAQVKRVILGEGRYIPAMAILDRENPIERVVGMQGDFERLDRFGYAFYRQRFPAIDDITRVGQLAPSSFSAEKAIALMPDVAFFGLEGHGPSPNDQTVVEQLERAGVTVVFIDFRRKPLENAPKSIALMGEVLGRQARAAEFITAYQQALARVTDIAGTLTDRPSVFIENRVGLSKDCCATMGDGMMGTFVEAAGGDNIAKPLVSGTHGTVSLEYLLKAQPDFYIGTAIGTAIGNADQAADADGRILLGPGVDAQHARLSLTLALDRRGIAELGAIRNDRAFGIWHHFYDSPFNIVAVQAFAKWLHPDAFADIDPNATMTELFERFQPIPADGTYWTGPS